MLPVESWILRTRHHWRWGTQTSAYSLAHRGVPSSVFAEAVLQTQAYLLCP